MHLKQLQSAFKRYVLYQDMQFVEQVSGKNEKFIQTRLNIYYQAYRLRFIEALQTDFPGIHALAGDEIFKKICKTYIDRYPSQYFSMRYFGQKLSDFLQRAEPYCEHKTLSDMAKFEWAIAQALDAANAKRVKIEDLQKVPLAKWPKLRFEFHPSLQILALSRNVPAFWQAVKAEQEITAPPEQYNKLVYWRVWRAQMQVFFCSQEEDETWMLQSAIQGEKFSQICEGLCQWHKSQDVASRAAELISLWISEKLVTSIKS